MVHKLGNGGAQTLDQGNNCPNDAFPNRHWKIIILKQTNIYILEKRPLKIINNRLATFIEPFRKLKTSRKFKNNLSF